MGLFDKLKHFAGGHGVSTKITRVERQEPDGATFPITDSVMKFNIEVQGEQPVTILAHEYEVWVERTDEENPRIILAGEDRHDETTDIHGADIKWPYELQPGQQVTDGCCMTDVDILAALRKMDVDDPAAVVNDPNYRFFVKFTADVKGSPMDAEIESDIRVTL